MKFIYKILFLCLISSSFQILFGQNYRELQKLQNEYQKVLEREAIQKPSEITEAEKTAKSTALPDKLIYSRKDIESLLSNTEKLLEQLKFFEDSTNNMPYIGYDFFTQRDTIPFWQNLPIPNNYKLGPGDEVIISLWGETNSYNSKTINRDGQIYLDNIGILNLSGKTINEAKKYVISKYSRVYSTLLGNNPKSFIDITLGELKSVNVHFVGFVNIPGVHMVHPFSNVVTGLTQAGGIDNNGSLRDINLIRNGKKVGTVDIYNYIFKGESVSDLRLIDQDIIYVPARKSTVPITGRSRKNGYFEILPDETISDLINFAGGRDSKASETIFYYNNTDYENNGFLLNYDKISSVSLSDGDSIHIPTKPHFDRFVFIDGQIKNSGKYPYEKNMTLTQLIEATMSLDDSDFMQTVDLSKIAINRKNPNGKSPIHLIVNLEEKNDINLSNGDFITISKKDLFSPLEIVKVTGEVKIPGVYPVNNSTSLANILELAGGYTDDAIVNGVEIFRDSVKIAWENDNFFLIDGDSLNIIKKSGLVLVSGEVNVPGYVSFNKGDSIKEYILRAGGYSAFAETKDVLVIYPNGTAVPNKRWFSPKVLEGSIIIVNQKYLSTASGPSGWEAFSIVSDQVSNFATTLLTLFLLINQTSGSS